MIAMLKLPNLSWHIQVGTTNIGGALQWVSARFAGWSPEPATSWTTNGRQRQHRVLAVERLDRRLLIHAACAGGFTYSPMMSAALRSKSGSFEAM
jgi:hypothetical protein